MRRWSGIFLVLSLVMAGCQHQNNEQTAFIEAKSSNRPIVAVVPVIDHSRNDLAWNLSQELSSAIQQRLVQTNHLYLPSPESFAGKTEKALASHHPFDADYSWVKKLYSPHEFVAFLELLEHREVPVSNAKDAPAQLNMTVRIRVFDIRGSSPKIVLQEIVEQSHHIPRQFTQTNFAQVPWGDEAYDVSPLGIAHDGLCKELTSRLEDYILLASK